MRPNLKSLLAASTLLAGLVAAPALYAQNEPAAPQSPMLGQGGTQGGPGMMGQGGMMQGGQGMMNMMGQMSEMMETCNEMMKGMMANRGSQRPDEQLQDREPGQPENRG
ncbi:hypothetical protein [Rhodoligotrophos defluvii]|uniref:hypothetical protein n=1 Tax=Rhodoligotrophos defluvii TaxID=2561934 RepID=UPI0010C9F493|nr:hypothetical protein [Rhodoligotrophos defluvii]